MRIALIGDVHANLPALEAVFEHALENYAQAVWNIGDFVGYNAFPNEVVSLLRRDDILNLTGNYDQKVLQVEEKREKWAQSKAPLKLFSFVWSFQQLSPANRAFLATLPEQRTLDVEGWRVLLVHGSPESNEEPLLPDTPEKRFEALAKKIRANIVICGHSHRPFARQVAGIWWINTGSVGRQDDGDPRATYALLDLTPGEIRVSHHRVEYDVARAVEAIRARGLPEAFAQMTERGLSLKDVEKLASLD